MPQIESLQTGRGLAALGVVVTHAAVAARDFGGTFTGFDILYRGYLGVDFFFVLSGFIIYHSTVGTGRTLKEYSLARFRRVYLPYWPVGIGMALLYTMLPHLSAADRHWSWLATLTLFPADIEPALSVAWTLQHEILFYALFALFYFSGMLPLGLCIWALAIVFVPDGLAFRTINLEFFFGIAACILCRRNSAHPALIILAPMLVAAWLYLGGREEHRVLVGLAFACLLAPIAQIELRRGIALPSVCMTLGAASYSIYLVHAPFVSIAGRLGWNAPTILVLSLILGVAAGLFYHFVVEKPLLTGRGHRRADSAPKAHSRTSSDLPR